MSADFLDDFDFAKLLAPLAREAFFDEYWERKPLFLDRGAPAYYDGLVTPEEVDGLIASRPTRLSHVPTTEKGVGEYQIALNDSDIGEFVYDAAAHGSTLVARAENRLPKLGLLCRLLGRELGYVFEAGLYVAPPGARAFRPHYDKTEVFVLQLVGRKQWHIDKTRAFVPRFEEHDSGDSELAPDHDSLMLAPGDLLYLPRGYVHAAVTQGEPSLQMLIRFTPPSWEDWLHAVVKRAADEDDKLKRALPPGFLGSDGAALAAGAAERLAALATRNDLGDMATQYLDEWVTQFPTDMAGQVRDILTGAALQADDRVGPRRGLVVRRRQEGEEIVILIGRRRVVLPDVFDEQLDFALATPVFAVRDLPGDLTDDEKAVFLQRLTIEGLIERKDQG